MLITKLVTFLSLSTAVLAQPAGESKRDVQLAHCPEGVCFDDAFYCDFETHLCRKKGGPGPCGSGECIENGDVPAPAPAPAKRDVNWGCMADVDCKFGVESCVWIRAHGEFRCVPKKMKVDSKTRGNGREKRAELKEAAGAATACMKRGTACGRNDTCCSGVCAKRHRFEIGLQTDGWCD
ncbi:hypothetical protein MGYG_00414 [Nannizzia gypsea CBS 118893]|uniref:Uncharacterized protein n=1 Tax=Arthroderma gypseum (strain ATCC MYA-4604 / CBS 118893) TaxID=535722 RepID=E5QZK8_ARTGP|nr:hypothetical protein MGYG_00414 [Nannizzia gypsea CBS 118893]EFQ97374.1 hypothetical protein MGYG_00414 [Nannizzia gypsea CBS 118893]